MTLSIVIPVFNEAHGIPSLLVRLATIIEPGVDTIFVDGGSTDDTVALVKAAGQRVITAPKGRAWQMNAGAAQTTGSILLFLHADTQLPLNAVAAVQAHLRGGTCWGRFDVRIAGTAWMLGVVAQMMNWRSRYTGVATGDQALFMTRAAFNSVGGFAEQNLMEDIEMSCSLKQLSRPACIRTPVITSGRRWETYGVWKTIFLMWRLRWAYWRGQSAQQLAQLYL